jgi:hypothetical protein
MKTPKTKLSDFAFVFSGYGHYKVIYTSPITGKKWENITNNMPLIDNTKNCDSPKQNELECLKRMCKQ